MASAARLRDGGWNLNIKSNLHPSLRERESSRERIAHGAEAPQFCGMFANAGHVYPDWDVITILVAPRYTWRQTLYLEFPHSFRPLRAWFMVQVGAMMERLPLPENITFEAWHETMCLWHQNILTYHVEMEDVQQAGGPAQRTNRSLQMKYNWNTWVKRYEKNANKQEKKDDLRLAREKQQEKDEADVRRARLAYVKAPKTDEQRRAEQKRAEEEASARAVANAEVSRRISLASANADADAIADADKVKKVAEEKLRIERAEKAKAEQELRRQEVVGGFGGKDKTPKRKRKKTVYPKRKNASNDDSSRKKRRGRK